MKNFIYILALLTVSIMANDTYYNHDTLCQEAYILQNHVHYTSPDDAKKLSAVVRGLQRWPMHPRHASILPPDKKHQQLEQYKNQIEQVKNKIRRKSLARAQHRRVSLLRPYEIASIMPQRNSH